VDYDAFIDAYIKEIDSYKSTLIGEQKIRTIFFGGGTPSLAPTKFFDKVLNHLSKTFHFADDIEITMEANPTSVEAGKFSDFLHAGINRVSLGIQSFDDKNLKFLGREHSAGEAKKAIEIAACTFDRFSFDLIYTLPNQTIETWEKELKQAFAFSPKHLSLYQLTIEKGTPFFSQHKKNIFQMPKDDHSAELFEFTNQTMSEYDLPPYEISNYSALNEECKHNLAYWQYDDFIGIGPGAHGRYQLGDKRFASMKIHSPNNWLNEVNSKNIGTQTLTNISPTDAFEEKIIMGLRIYRPIKVDISKLRNVEMLQNLDLITVNDDEIMVTQKGRLLLNKIISELL